MICKEFEELMTAYLERELPLEKRSSLERHIESCKRCQEEMSTYEKGSRIFRRFVNDEAPPETLRKAVFEKCGCDDPTDCYPPPKRNR